MEKDSETPQPSRTEEAREKLQSALKGLNPDALQSIKLMEEAMKIADPVERLQFLGRHQKTLEADRDALVNLLDRAGLSENTPEDPEN